MRLVSPLATCFILALALAACGSDEDGSGDERRPVTVPPDTFRDAESCDALDPECPDGTFCAVVWTEGGETGPTCVDDDICDLLSCDGDDQCTVAESFPSQIFCSGTCTGPDCDEPTQS
jgi:hypothetical protein